MTAGFSRTPPDHPRGAGLFDDDVKETCCVWNGSRLQAYQPVTVERLLELMSVATSASAPRSSSPPRPPSGTPVAPWRGAASPPAHPDTSIAAGVVKGTGSELTARSAGHSPPSTTRSESHPYAQLVATLPPRSRQP